MPIVSVIVTTKNEEANLPRCLGSVQAQTYADIEIIVVDNASTDQTKALARKYTPHVYDCGPERSAQRNFGVAKSHGVYILYLDADMALEPTAVAECVVMMTKDAALFGLYIPERIVGEGFWIKVRDFERSFYDGTVIDAVRFVDRRVYLEIDGFDSTLFGGEDWDFDKRLRQLGATAVIKSKVFHDEGRFSLERYLKKKAYYAGSLDAYAEKWPTNDPDVRRQIGGFYRFFAVFFENGKSLRLLSHPILALAMYWLRFRVGIAYLRRSRNPST